MEIRGAGIVKVEVGVVDCSWVFSSTNVAELVNTSVDVGHISFGVSIEGEAAHDSDVDEEEYAAEAVSAGPFVGMFGSISALAESIISSLSSVSFSHLNYIPKLNKSTI